MQNISKKEVLITTDTEKLYNLIDYIKDAESYYLNEKVTELNSGKVCAIQDILLYIKYELNINIIVNCF